MILTQKPVTHFHPAMGSAHRRHPSAPTMVQVHPTHTPGLLSLSKPLNTTTGRPAQRQPRTPKPRHAHAAQRSSPAPEHAQAVAVLPAAPADKEKQAPAAPSPEKPTRGRHQTKANKDKTSRRFFSLFLFFH